MYRPLFFNNSALSWIFYSYTLCGISGGSSTTAFRHISSRSGSIQTTNGNVSGKAGAFHILSCAGTRGKPTAPTVAGLSMCMDSLFS